MENRFSSEVSEFDVLEWITQLSMLETRETARKRLRSSGLFALPWLIRSYEGPASDEITSLIREIVSAHGIPRRGRSIVLRILGSVA